MSRIQNQKIRDSGPGLKIEKSGIGDWDRDSDLRDEGFRDSTLGDWKFSGSRSPFRADPGHQRYDEWRDLRISELPGKIESHVFQTFIL